MTTVEFAEGVFSVDAALIAAGLGVEPRDVQTRMREGTLTSLCERGVDEDEGRHRLTFFFGQRRLRLLVDDAGSVISQSVETAAGPRSRGARRVPSG